MVKEFATGSNDPKLEARLAVLEEMFVQLARAGATDNILGGGFGSVSDQLETVSKHLEGIQAQMAPLKSLSAPKAALGRDEKARLKNLINSWRPPRWNGLGAVSIEEKTVRYIGQGVPDQPTLPHSADIHDRSAAS